MTTATRFAVYVNGVEMIDGEVSEDEDREVMWSQGPRVDPRWEFTDGNGHYHGWSEDKHGPYPTLEAVSEPQPCDGSCNGVCRGEGYSITRYFCRLCREEIEPGVIPGPYQFSVPMLKTWSVKVKTDGWRWMPGDTVSVRVVEREQVRFGVAVVSSFTSESITSDSHIFTVELDGTGPLGRRKA